MKSFIHLATVFLAGLLLGCSGSDSSREVPQYTIEQFMSNINMFGAQFSHDESQLLITSDQSGIYNLFSLPVEGGELQALTQSDSTSLFGESYFPEDNRILFSSDDNGNEVYHIFLLEEDGTARDLTPDSAARSTFYQWMHDKQSFVYGSNKRDARYMDLYEMDIETFTPEMIYENSEGLDVTAISRDERYLALVKTITTTNDELYLYDRETKKLKHISAHEGNANYSASEFGHDNTSLYYLTNEGDEFTYLVKYDIASGKKEKVLEYNWDIWYSYLSEEGTYRITGINEDARTVVKLTQVSTGEEIDFPSEIQGDIKNVKVSPSEELMSFWVGSSKSPSELYVFDFTTKKAEKLASGLNPDIDADDLVEGEVVRYPSFDGLEIPAILYKPHQVSAKKPGPALVWVHGGPGGQSRLSYFPLLQYLVNHGYTIIAVNNRGSSGYGKTFYSLDDRNHGEKDLMDCIMAKDYLATLGYVDTNSIGILGGSYGGFMVMAALTSHPTAFETGVNIFGVTNWIRTLKSIPPWWESFRQALYDELGDPETDSARLYRISPLFHANLIERPFMVLQGANDPRVLQVESDEIVAAARHNGVEVEYVLFEDEGHGFAKKDNQIEAYEKILIFLDKQLRGVETDEVPAPESE